MIEPKLTNLPNINGSDYYASFNYHIYNYFNNYFLILNNTFSDNYEHFDVLTSTDNINFNTNSTIKVDLSTVYNANTNATLVLSKKDNKYWFGPYLSKNPEDNLSIFYSENLEKFSRIDIPDLSSSYSTLSVIFYSNNNTYLVMYVSQNKTFNLYLLNENKATLLNNGENYLHKSLFTDYSSYFSFFNNNLYIANNNYTNWLKFTETSLEETSIDRNSALAYNNTILDTTYIKTQFSDLKPTIIKNYTNLYYLAPVYDYLFKSGGKNYIYNIKTNTYEEINNYNGYDIFSYNCNIIYTEKGFYINLSGNTNIPEDIRYKTFFISSLSDNTPKPNPDEGDGTGGMTPTNPDTEGGDGNFDNTNDNIDLPSLPVVDASAVGMLSLYNPTGGELQDFANFLWSPGFYESIQRFFSDTADAVINLGIVPLQIPGPMEKKDVSICALRSGVKMNVIENQYVEYYLGSYKIEKYFGSFLDYAPYTNIQIYIPFVGYQTLNTDEVMGNELHLNYFIDLATGNFTCYLKVVRDDVFYISNIYTGNMMSKYCISSRSFDQFISAGITVAGTIASAGLATLSAISTTTAATTTATKAAKSSTVNSSTTALATQGTRAISTNVHIPLNTFTPPEPTDPPVPNIDNIIVKPPVVRTGSLSGSDPLFAPKEAFIIINRPNPAIANKYSSFYGFRGNFTETLSNLSGYTKVSAVNLKGFESATIEEKQTIKDQLISGIIL